MSLAETLAQFKTPREHDTYLANIWSNFRGSEPHQALEVLLTELSRKATDVILSPALPADQRTFAAGVLSATDTLRRAIDAAASFDPTAAEYPDPSTPDAAPEDSDPELDVVY